MFARKSPYDLIGIDEAWRRVAASLNPLPPTTCPMAEALGLVLAEAIVASENMPPFASSAMDGYAVIASDPASERRVIGEQDAGPLQELHVMPGTAARIMTGAALPEGADSVVPVENTVEENGIVRLLSSVTRGQFVRPVGQDIAAGDAVLEAGTAIGPAEVGLLATVGRTQAPVYPRPVVAVMATGDELVPADRKPGPGQIRDSNSHALVAAIRTAGCTPLRLGVIPDTMEALRSALLRGVTEAQMVLTSGGVSMGARDLIKPLLEELGTIHFGRVAQKPGKPLTFATVRGVPVFGLPGFPVSSLVSFENFVRPALRLMGGHRMLWRPEVQARLSHRVRHAPDRTEFQRANLEMRGGEYWATVTGDQVSGRLKSLVGANGLLRLPEGQGDFGQGESVTAILIDHSETR